MDTTASFVSPSHPGALRLTLDNQFHIPVLGTSHVADHAAVGPRVLLQCPVEVEAAVSPDRAPAARWELGRGHEETECG